MNIENSEINDIGDLEALTGFLLKRVSRSFSTHFLETLPPEIRLSRATVGVMAIVYRQPGVCQSEIAMELGVQRANLVPLVSDLEKRRLISRATGKVDKRTFPLTLTELGIETFNFLWPKIKECESGLLRSLTSVEIMMFNEILKKIYKDLSGETASLPEQDEPFRQFS